MKTKTKKFSLILVLLLVAILCLVLAACSNDSQAAPTISNSDITVSNDTITVRLIENASYSKDGGTTWQESNVFSGLNYGETYQICVKLNSGDKIDESPKSNVVNVTLTDPVVLVANSTAITVQMVQKTGTAFTWNGQAVTGTYADGKYTIAVPKITKVSNTLGITGAGNVSITFDAKSAGNVKVATNSDELNNIIKNQADGEVWLVKEGTYNLSRDKKFPNEQKFIDRSLVADAYEWYMPIYRSVEIYGSGMPVLTSSTYSANADYSSQEFIRVAADNVVIDGFKIEGKREANKVVCVSANKFTLKNCEIAASPVVVENDDKFAGSIYFYYIDPGAEKFVDNAVALIENVKLTSGRITATGTDSSSQITLRNVDIDWTDVAEEFLLPPYFAYGNTGGAHVAIDGFKVRLGASMGDQLEEALALLPEGTEVTLAAGEYYVDEALSESIILEPGATVYLNKTVSSAKDLKVAIANEDVGCIIINGEITTDALEFTHNLKIDLNGKTLTVADITVKNGAVCSFADTDTNGKGKLVGQITATGNGTAVTISSGSYDSAQTKGERILIADEGASVEITGGTFNMIVDADADTSLMKVQNEATLTVTGGKFTAGSYGLMCGKNGHLIFGGTAELTAVKSAVASNNTLPVSDIVITGGKLTSTTRVAIHSPATGRVVITGGIIQGTSAIEAKNGIISISGKDTILIATGESFEIMKTADDEPNGDGSVIVLNVNRYTAGAGTSIENETPRISLTIGSEVQCKTAAEGCQIVTVYDRNITESDCTFNFGEKIVKYFNDASGVITEVDGIDGNPVDVG